MLVLRSLLSPRLYRTALLHARRMSAKTIAVLNDVDLKDGDL